MRTFLILLHIMRSVVICSFMIQLVLCLTLDDIFIVVKTTRHYQDTRLPIIFNTWFKNAQNQTWFVTDVNNTAHQIITNGHMHVTNCHPNHTIAGLCCKTAAEFNLFFKKNKNWFCHFDDDNYVNVNNLIKLLKKFNYKSDWYFGHYPLLAQTILEERPFVKPFSYATLGAGCCISRGLALRLEPDGSGNNLMNTCNFINRPDDVTLGFMIQARYKVKLMDTTLFNSHYNNLSTIPEHKIKYLISVSYLDKNIITIPGLSEELDPTRFYSLHCYLSRDEKCLNKTFEQLMTQKEYNKHGFWAIFTDFLGWPTQKRNSIK